MNLPMPKPLTALLAVSLGLSSCTIIDTHTSSDPVGVHLSGIVDGYASFGLAESRGLFRLGVLDGPNDGSVVSVNLANLLAVDVGVVGAALTIGPLHLGLGTLFYSPSTPEMIDWDDEDEPADGEVTEVYATN